LWVFFGTGQYLHESDITSTAVQTWYGIIDGGSLVTRANLVDRDILVEVDVGGVPARVIEEGSSADLASSDGWYIDLVSPTADPADGLRGERMVVQNRFQGLALVGTTRIPEYSDPCSPGGTGYIMAINPFTGARLNSTFFDMNGDGISNDDDQYCVASVCVPVSGLGFESMPINSIVVGAYLQASLASGETESIMTFGSSVEASRMSWRELFNTN
jgi:type IV pilus assembly protein PilY1